MDGIHKVRCLFDTGSQRTMILEETARKLGLVPHAKVELMIEGVGTQCKANQNFRSYPLVKCVFGTNDGLVELDAIVANELPNRIVMSGIEQEVKKVDFKGMTLADPEISDFSRLDVLIGVDNYYKFVYGNHISKGLYAIPSNVGSLLAGTISCNNSTTNRPMVATVLRVQHSEVIEDHNNLNNALTNIWNLDTVGMFPKTNSNEHDLILEQFEKSISYDNGKYTVCLPWKSNHPTLESNYGMVYKRLQCNLENLRKDESQLQLYDKIIKEQVNLGFIEEVGDKEAMTSTKVHYLAHQAVFKDSKTTPLRIVFDCSAKPSKQSPSLNECLHSGPSLVNELCGVILRFRMNEFACTADIEKAFLQVGLNVDDRCHKVFMAEKP